MAPKNPPGVARKQSQPVCRDPKNTSSGHKSRFSCFLNAGETAPPGPKPASRKPNDQTVVQNVFVRQISALQKACSEAPQDISPTSPLHPDDASSSYPLLSLDRRSSHSDSTLNIISGLSNLSSWDMDDELMAVSMLEMAKTPNNVNTTANNKPAVKQRGHDISESGLQQLNPQPWPDVKFEHLLLPPNTKLVDGPTDALPVVHVIAPIKNRDPSPATQRQGFSLPSTTRSRVQSSVKRSSSSTNSCRASSKASKINTTKQQQQRKTAAEKKLATPRLNRFGGIYIGSHFAPFGSAPREGASQKTKLGAKEGPKVENKDEPPNPFKSKPNVWKRNNSWKKPGGLLTQANKTMGGPFSSSANHSPPCARPNITSSNVHSQPGQDRGPKFHGPFDHERGSQNYLRKPFWKSRGHSFKSKSDFWRRMLKTHKSKFLMASSRLKKRVDWSTDSGYAESAVSSHDWLTGWGVSKEEMLLTASNDGIKSLQASLGRSLSHSLEKKTNRSVTYSLSLTTVKELSDNTSRQTLLNSNKALRKRSHSTLSNQKTEKAPVEEKIRKVMMESQSVYSDLSMNVSDTRSIRSEWTSNGLGTTIASEWDSLPGAIIRYCDGDTEEQVTVLQRLKTHVFNIRWSCGNACPDGLVLKTQNVPTVSFSDISDYALQMGNSTDKSQNQETYMPVVKAGFNSNTRRTTERSCQDTPALTRPSSAILSEAIFSQNTHFFSLECLQQRVETTSPANSLDNIPVPFVGGNYFAQAADKMGGRNGAVKRWLGAQEAHGESLTQTSYGMVANFTRNLWVKKALYRLRKKPNDFKRNQESGWKWPIFLLIVVFIIFMCLLLAYLLTTSTLNIKNTAEPLE